MKTKSELSGKNTAIIPLLTATMLPSAATESLANGSPSQGHEGDNPQGSSIQERDFLRALLEHASDRIFFKDRHSCSVRCSHATAERFGVSDQEIIGKSDFNFFDDSHAQPAFHDEQEIMRTGQPVTGKVEREVMKNGEELWALTAKWPLRNEKGAIIGTFGISKDITALKQAEGKLDATPSTIGGRLAPGRHGGSGHQRPA